MTTMNLYVATNGNDQWSGARPEPNAQGTDGPLATVDKARQMVRQIKESGRLRGALTVWIRGGRYALAQPLVFTPEDSGPITYAAYKDEKPIFDGGRRITGLRAEKLNGREVWTADLPEVRQGQWYFRELFVNGQRRSRTRYPKTDKLWIKDVPGITLDAQLFDGADSFLANPQDLPEFRNPSDIEVIIRHFWVQERMPVKSIDRATGLINSTRRSVYCLRDGFSKRWAPYWFENVFEALEEPGQWYLDRVEGKLYYLPQPGEKIERVKMVAPRLTLFLRCAGQPDEGRFVEFLNFRGLTFEYADWYQPKGGRANTEGGDMTYASAGQGASTCPGVLQLEGARYCVIEDCEVRHVGFYAIELADGCTGNRVVGNHLHDLGAGGVLLNGAEANGPQHRRTGNNRVTDNHIHAGGRVFEAGIGILGRHVFGCVFNHNHIHDLYYTGISVGWVWGYKENVARDNRIEYNHIHDIGQRVLSDMGGIYTLGVQPGTVIRHNLIHEVRKYQYGGWAIYPDEGSSHILIENNVCYDTDSSCFHVHFGRENVVRNNIFAFGNEGIVALGRGEDHVSFTLERNILISDGQPIYHHGYQGSPEGRHFHSDLNLFWDIAQEPPLGAGMERNQKKLTFTLAQLRELGYDLYSIVANPKVKNLKKRDFTLAKDSPALKLGFQPIDLSNVGPRPAGKRD